jgi:hypothetical protein
MACLLIQALNAAMSPFFAEIMHAVIAFFRGGFAMNNLP